MKRTQSNGYTAAEILLIGLLLMILAFLVTPGAIHAYDSIMESRLQKNMQHIYDRIIQYRADHNGAGPHLDENGEIDTERMINRMTSGTFPNGMISRYGPCGPYMQEWPSNPFSPNAISQTVKFGFSKNSPRDGSSGWYYDLNTCLVSPNSPKGGVKLSTAAPKPAERQVPVENTTSGFRFGGIMQGPEGIGAMINGHLVKVGDTINNANVVEIDSHSVTLELEGHKLILDTNLPSGDEGRPGE